MVPQRWPRQARTLSGAWLAIDDMRERIDGMQLADEVAAEVKKELDKHRMYTFTALQKIGAAALAVLAVADFVLNLVHSSGHG